MDAKFEKTITIKVDVCLGGVGVGIKGLGEGSRGWCSIDNDIFREARLLVSSSQLPVTLLSWKMIATERMDYSSHRNDSTHTDFFSRYC